MDTAVLIDGLVYVMLAGAVGGKSHCAPRNGDCSPDSECSADRTSGLPPAPGAYE